MPWGWLNPEPQGDPNSLPGKDVNPRLLTLRGLSPTDWHSAPSEIEAGGFGVTSASSRVWAEADRLLRVSGDGRDGDCGGVRTAQLELPLLQFVPVAPCPVAGHH